MIWLFLIVYTAVLEIGELVQISVITKIRLYHYKKVMFIIFVHKLFVCSFIILLKALEMLR